MIFLSQENTRSLAADFSAFGCLGSFQIAIDCHRLPEAVEFANTALRWARNALSSTNVLSKGQRHQRRQLERLEKRHRGMKGPVLGPLMLCFAYLPQIGRMSRWAQFLHLVHAHRAVQGASWNMLESGRAWQVSKGLHDAGSRADFRL